VKDPGIPLVELAFECLHSSRLARFTGAVSHDLTRQATAPDRRCLRNADLHLNTSLEAGGHGG
jgi:hypothetical protein